MLPKRKVIDPDVYTPPAARSSEFIYSESTIRTACIINRFRCVFVCDLQATWL